MTTIADRPVTGITPGLMEAAMYCTARGRTAQYMRDRAEDVLLTGRVAAVLGITLADARDQMLGTAMAIEVVEAKGLTPEQCYFLLHLDETLGPWTGVPVLAA